MKLKRTNHSQGRLFQQRLSPKAYRAAGRLFQLKKSKLAMKEVKRLKTYCARLYREILHVASENPTLQKRIPPVFFVIGEILMQTADSKEKVYSLHEPQVECIAKGKAHKKYEFGNKAAITVMGPDRNSHFKNTILN